METSEKRDHVLENPRRHAGEPEKQEDWKGTSQELEYTHIYVSEERLMGPSTNTVKYILGENQEHIAPQARQLQLHFPEQPASRSSASQTLLRAPSSTLLRGVC